MTRAMVTGWIAGGIAGVFVQALGVQSWWSVGCVFAFSVAVTLVALPVKS
jgi:hypothetical protein